MAFALDGKRAAVTLAAVAATVFLVWLGMGMQPWWPASWFMTLPILLLAVRRPLATAAVAAFVAWFAGTFVTMWGYLHGVLGMPALAVLGIFAGLALVFVIAVVLFRALLLRGACWSAVLVFPALWVGFGYTLNLTASFGTAISVAYTQLGFLPLLQLASITGPWGMSFLLFLFPAVIAAIVYLRPGAPATCVRVAVTCGIVFVAVLVYGTVRLAMPVTGHRVQVGLVASDAARNDRVAAPGAATQKLIQTYADRAAALARRGAHVVVLPEKLGTIAGSATQGVDAILQSVSDRTGAVLVAGFVRTTQGPKYNVARVYAPGAPVLEYRKEHLLPVFQSRFGTGKSLVTFSRPSGLWGVAICKDMDFKAPASRYGKAGVGLMLVPAWDFDVDWIYHGHIAIMRGVENGFSIVRAAKQGSVYVSDSRGRILAETRSDSAPFATLMVEVPAVHVPTPYQRLGNWFAWLTLAILLFTLVRLGQVLYRRNLR